MAYVYERRSFIHASTPLFFLGVHAPVSVFKLFAGPYLTYVYMLLITERLKRVKKCGKYRAIVLRKCCAP